jgi:hypothetical protein
MNRSMAYSYILREWKEASVLSTAALDCSSSGTVMAAGRLTDLRCCFLNTGSGSLYRFPSFPLTNAEGAHTIAVVRVCHYRKMRAGTVDANLPYHSLSRPKDGCKNNASAKRWCIALRAQSQESISSPYISHIPGCPM